MNLIFFWLCLACMGVFLQKDFDERLVQICSTPTRYHSSIMWFDDYGDVFIEGISFVTLAMSFGPG